MNLTFNTHWDNLFSFLKDPIGYLRPIAFKLLNELITPLADGIVSYIKEKWGDEK
ncbi:unnamed protein product [marine sediment metagenome]|uniref:Uncharacterized protein n=1 Tax=marine sediment metagenome TaxID=412755 RepID=X1USH3_9ZZZZ